MPALVNKNKLTLCTTAFFLSAVSAQALELRLNGNSNFDIVGAGYVDVLSGETVVSEPSSEEVKVILNADAKAETQTKIKIKLTPFEAIEVFWNDLPVEVGESDSQWLFFHGSCDKAKKLFTERQPDDSIFVAPDSKCKSYRDSGDMTATKVIIQRQLPLGTLPNQQDSVYFSPDVLNEPFNPPFLDLGLSMPGKTGSDLFTHQKLAFGSQKHPLIAEQLAFLADPARYPSTEITVFIANLPISGRAFRDLPASDSLNDLVDMMDTVNDLSDLILQAMRELGYTTHDPDNPLETDNLEGFLLSKSSSLEEVNVQMVRNFIVQLLRQYNKDSPDVNKGNNIKETVKKIILRMLKIEFEKISDDEEPVAGAAGYSESVAGATGYSELTSEQEGRIERLLEHHGHRSYEFLTTLGRIIWGVEEFNQFNLDEVKDKIKGKKGSINAEYLRELMRTSPEFERLLEQADEKISRDAKRKRKGKGSSQNSSSTKPEPKGPKGPKGPKNGKKPTR